MRLDIQHLKKSYNNRTEALHDVSFSIETPSFLSVIGTSGAGKTTLFRLLNGTLQADSGSILFNGNDLSRLRGRERRRLQSIIGTVYQDFCLVEPVSCLENVLNACLPGMNPVAGSLGLFGAERRKEALRLLERVGLGDKPEEPVRNLSGGQKQRVAIARALMQHPALLLADEPVASLDPVTGRQILDLLRELQQSEGLTVLMNSHNPTLSAEFSDRILGLRGGCIVFDDIPDRLTPTVLAEIYRSPTVPEVSLR